MAKAAQAPNDYRIFVGAFPEGDLAARIQLIRERYDAKTASITAPHVTLAGTYWRSGPATPENEAGTIARLQAVQDRLRAFDLVVGGVETFLPGTPVIYLHVELNDGLLSVRKTLLEALSPDTHGRFTPHLTLTMRLSREKTQSLFQKLREGEWRTQRKSARIDHLWLMQRGSSDPAWRYIHRIDLTEGAIS